MGVTLEDKFFNIHLNFLEQTSYNTAYWPIDTVGVSFLSDIEANHSHLLVKLEKHLARVPLSYDLFGLGRLHKDLSQSELLSSLYVSYGDETAIRADVDEAIVEKRPLLILPEYASNEVERAVDDFQDILFLKAQLKREKLMQFAKNSSTDYFENVISVVDHLPNELQSTKKRFSEWIAEACYDMFAKVETKVARIEHRYVATAVFTAAESLLEKFGTCLREEEELLREDKVLPNDVLDRLLQLGEVYDDLAISYAKTSTVLRDSVRPDLEEASRELGIRFPNFGNFTHRICENIAPLYFGSD